MKEIESLMTTLISFIGTGMYDEKDGGYRKTKYVFRDGKHFETSNFLEALLQANIYEDLDNIAIVGTNTSDWGVFIAKDSSQKDLFDRLFMTRLEKEGVSQKDLDELSTVLEQMYKKKFTLYFHTNTIDKETTEEIFNVYKEIAKKLPKESKILLDITHGFRTMPILLYQTLQYAFENEFGNKISLVYGEFVKDEKVSYVRDLSGFLEYAEIASGFKLFNERFDSRILSEKCSAVWKEGSKWLNRYTALVQTNYFLQIFEVQKNLNNILLKGLPSKSPSWMQDLYLALELLNKRLVKHEKSKKILEFSKILKEKKLYTQAVIALQVCVEAKALELFGDWDKLGDYDYWQEAVKKKYDDYLRGDFTNKVDKKDVNRLRTLEHVRNQIAHGGAKGKRSGGDPKAENIENQYNSFLRVVELLFN